MQNLRLLVSVVIVACSFKEAGAFLPFPPAFSPARQQRHVACPSRQGIEPRLRSAEARLMDRSQSIVRHAHVADEEESAKSGKTPVYKRPSEDEPYELEAMPEAFGEVLGMLRELDRNGSWPSTSRRRSGLLKNTTRRESIGDSFTIGLFPPPLRMPHANEQLPGLLDALLRLEKAICPARPCSTTITVNRHAEFRPHRDSGAGAGQSSSLIVGLGDYIGGSLMVEGQPHDIRYRGLEFDGWRQLHWTRPFRGERYSLVW